jgi:hypothetical protein
MNRQSDIVTISNIPTRSPKRDYTYFVFDAWGVAPQWASRVVKGCPLEPQVRGYYWGLYHEQIQRELQGWLAQGYQVEGTIGAEAIKVYLVRQTKITVDMIDVILWVATFGLALLIHLLSRQERVFAVYRPIEFRVKLYCPEPKHWYEEDFSPTREAFPAIPQGAALA